MRLTNIMFDGISSKPALQCVLTDIHLKAIGSNQSWLKQRFKNDSRACGNLMPVSMYRASYRQELMTNTMNRAIKLIDYNKDETKQLGTCCVVAKFGSITKCVYFYIVSDRVKLILGVGDAVTLKLTSFHCPIYDSWHSSHDLTKNMDSIQNDSGHTSKPATATCLTKEGIINDPCYSKLFSGIGRFHCQLVHNTMRQDGTPVQKPPRRVPLALYPGMKVVKRVLNGLTHLSSLKSLVAHRICLDKR